MCRAGRRVGQAAGAGCRGSRRGCPSRSRCGRPRVPPGGCAWSVAALEVADAPFGADAVAGRAARAPSEDVAGQEAPVPSDADRWQRPVGAPGVLVDARARDGEEDGDLVGGHEWLVELGLAQAEGFHAEQGASRGGIQHPSRASCRTSRSSAPLPFMTPFSIPLERWTGRLPLGPVAAPVPAPSAFLTTRPHHHFVPVVFMWSGTLRGQGPARGRAAAGRGGRGGPGEGQRGGWAR